MYLYLLYKASVSIGSVFHLSSLVFEATCRNLLVSGTHTFVYFLLCSSLVMNWYNFLINFPHLWRVPIYGACPGFKGMQTECLAKCNTPRPVSCISNKMSALSLWLPVSPASSRHLSLSLAVSHACGKPGVFSAIVWSLAWCMCYFVAPGQEAKIRATTSKWMFTGFIFK